MRFIAVPGHAQDVPKNISNQAVVNILKEIGIQFLVTVPESMYEGVLKGIASDPSIELLQVCRESEGVSICSGLSMGGSKVAMLCSFKGLYNSVDSLLGTAVRTQASFLFLVSESSTQAERAVDDLEEGLYSAEILKAIKVPFFEVANDSEIDTIKKAWEKTKTATKPVAVILRW